MAEDTTGLIKKLEKALAEENVTKAESYISLIASSHHSNAISQLLSLLEDNYIYDELMYSLIHTAENFDDVVYVTGLLTAIPALCKESPEWASIVVMRSLNSDQTRAELVNQVRSSPVSVKTSLEWLLNKINEESPEFLAKTIAVLVACKG